MGVLRCLGLRLLWLLWLLCRLSEGDLFEGLIGKGDFLFYFGFRFSVLYWILLFCLEINISDSFLNLSGNDI